MQFTPGILRRLLAVLALLAATATVPHGITQQANNPDPAVTRVRVGRDVAVSGVKRLGINLGNQSYFDAGQMMKNLLFRNPGFEGMAYRTIFHCEGGGASTCIDRRQGVQFPQDFWEAAGFEVIDGLDLGRKGKVTSCGPEPGGYGLRLDAGGKAIGTGDWIAVAKDFPQDPAAGWWPTLIGGALLKPERVDLSPSTQGHQALRIEASGPGQQAQIKSFFDTLEGFSFVRLHGSYRLSFRARALAGSKMLHLSVRRVAQGSMSNLERDMKIMAEWADYHQDFTANESAGPIGPVEVSLTLTGGSMLLDDVVLEKTGADPANHTAFRDEVVETLKELHPGLLRLMSTNAGLGSTIENLLAPPLARQRAGFSAWFLKQEDVPLGIPEFLELCLEIGAEPWIVAPTAISRDEARKLAEYLAAAPETPGGALRLAAGRREPWTRAFSSIHIELGNETWNGVYQGETITAAAAYGRRANTVFAAMRSAAGAEAGRLDLVVGAQSAAPGRNAEILAAAPLANTLAIAPYLMHNVSRWTSDDELYAPLMAQPEQMSREGELRAAQAASGGRRLAVYEVNLHTTEGSAPQSVLGRFASSAAAGVAVAGHMLRMMRDHGVRDQMLYSLPQFQYKRPDGEFVRLWGAVLQMGAEGRKRPQFLAESLVNRVARGNMVRVQLSGQNPTHDQPPGNDGVQLKSMHELDAYAFQDGAWHGMVLFNFGLRQRRRLLLEAPGLLANRGVRLWRLSSPSPGATNEAANQVKIVEETFSGAELQLEPASMAVLEWSE